MRICDGSRFSEFKPLYGSTLVCVWWEGGRGRVGTKENFYLFIYIYRFVLIRCVDLLTSMELLLVF